MAQRRRSRIGKTGCLFWLFVLLVIIVIFVYKGRGNLKESFKFVKNNPITESFKKSDKETEKETAQGESKEKISIVKESPQAEESADVYDEVYADESSGKDKEQRDKASSDTVDKETSRTKKTEPEKTIPENKTTSIEKESTAVTKKNGIKTKET